jgi:adenylate cyclase
MTEDLITDLSKISGLFVIARNSTFTYKGTPVKIRQVAEELGVQYILEGSVQKSGGRVRINSQLIDATTGYHVWAKRYNRELIDIFEIQDEITSDIVLALNVQLVAGEQARLYRKVTNNPKAYDYFMKAMALFRRFRKGDNALARNMFEKALKLDENSAMLVTMLAWTHWEDARFGWSPSRSKSFELAIKLASRALALDDTSPDVHALLSGIHLYKREFDLAVTEGKRAVALAPNGADYAAVLAQTLLYSGQPEDAGVFIKKAMRLSPFYPKWYMFVLGEANRVMGKHKEAIEAFKAYIDRSPNSRTTRVALAATLIATGKEKEARAVAAGILKIDPKFSLKLWRKSQFYKDPKELELLIALARKAGLK